jgi:predicted kinase
VGQGGGGGEVVDGDEFDVGIAESGAEDVASDAAEAVDANLYCHEDLPVQRMPGDASAFGSGKSRKPSRLIFDRSLDRRLGRMCLVMRRLLPSYAMRTRERDGWRWRRSRICRRCLLQENEAAGRTAQDPKGFVVLTIGLPGSGKTTWFKRRGVTPLSSDMLRTILFDDITEQRYQGLVFSTLRSLLRARLIARMPWNYVDATNLSPHERRQWIKMAKSFGYEVQAVFFDVPLEVCLERNRKRDRPVSDDVMQKMAERLKPPAFDEGFSKITVVRVKSS